MSLFVCSKCGCIDNTATSYYWALIRPCKNRIYDKSLKGYEGKPLCSECAAIEYDKDDKLVVVPGTWHQARKVTIRAGNNATKNLVKTFRGKLFKKAFGRARRGKDISSFERQEKESGFNFLYNPNNGRMRSGHIIIDGIGLFKQIIESGT